MRIQRLQQLMAAGREAEAAGDYAAALRSYDAVVQLFPDFGAVYPAKGCRMGSGAHARNRLARPPARHPVPDPLLAAATTEYARLARARVLYQLGQVSSAILQLEDLEVTLRGYAEVHAALAAILYVERPALLELAEQQARLRVAAGAGGASWSRGLWCMPARYPPDPRPLSPPRDVPQWEIAMEFNQQFADRGWVSATKQWPPRLMVALDRFLALS